MLPDSILRVVSSGGGVIVDGSKVLPDTLIRIASTAATAGVTLTIRNADSILPDTAMRIASSGKGHVIFDLT